MILWCLSLHSRCAQTFIRICWYGCDCWRSVMLEMAGELRTHSGNSWEVTMFSTTARATLAAVQQMIQFRDVVALEREVPTEGLWK
ncbi:hypothetical protein Bca4012_017635 [Brassica carinata]